MTTSAQPINLKCVTGADGRLDARVTDVRHEHFDPSRIKVLVARWAGPGQAARCRLVTQESGNLIHSPRASW
ncbi:hypothetical protein GCM10009546_14620 [Actinomadura livida]|uniref:Uncharacterized protein n=1 Tax=Actinomadura livida TaxID=79909 RepID=A0ABN1DW04_9ACTN|nr:hypothetical protein GCM10010208_58700 [Actinomadura livida]